MGLRRVCPGEARVFTALTVKHVVETGCRKIKCSREVSWRK